MSLLTGNEQNYKPVLVIHGLSGSPFSMKFFTEYITKRHAGTKVKVIDRYNSIFSLADMWTQVNQIREDVRKFSQDYPLGFHLIGYSQGALIARGVIETLSEHKVENFISMVGPHQGQYGKTATSDWLPKYNWVKENFRRLMYTRFGQMISIGGYWKDPRYIDEYLEYCQYLPLINNEKKHDRNEEFKENLLKLKKMILIASVNDTTITPWQSTQFGFYDENEIVVLMQDQEIYRKDYLGLKTMFERGDLILDTVTGLDHDDLDNDASFIENHVLPWLT